MNSIKTSSVIAGILNLTANGSAVQRRIAGDVVAQAAPEIGYGTMRGLLAGELNFTINGENIVIGDAKPIVATSKAKRGPKSKVAVAA